MQYSIALISAFAASSLAVPLSSVTGKRTFQVTQVPNPEFKGLTGPKAAAQAYSRYGLTSLALAVALPAAQNKATSGTGSVSAAPQSYDFEYLCPVKVGGQTLNLNFDTGSSDLWVFSSLQPASQRAGHSYYNSSLSKTYTPMSGSTWSISYLDGSGASGVVGTDIVNVGGVSVNTSIELANTASDSFVSDTGSSGILGLGWPSINQVQPVKQQPFFFQALSSLASPVFTVALKKGAPGSYDFGFIDPKKYLGKINYVNVDTSRGWWQFTSAGYKVGTSSYRQTLPTIADTGTSILLMDKNAVTAYYAKVTGAKNSPSQGGYVFPCNSVLPSFSIELGGGYYGTMAPALMNYGPLYTGSPTCFGSLQSNGNLGLQVLGDIIFKSQFTVFNGQTKQIGFAAQL